MGISKDERDKLLQAAQRWVNGTTQMMADEERAAEAFVKLLDELTHPDTCMCGQQCQYCTDIQNSPKDNPTGDWWMKQSITLKERGHDTQNEPTWLAREREREASLKHAWEQGIQRVKQSKVLKPDQTQGDEDEDMTLRTTEMTFPPPQEDKDEPTSTTIPNS